MSSIPEQLDSSLINLDQLQRELIHTLHELLRGPSDEPTRVEMLAMVQQLFSLLPVQFDKKSCEGYLFDSTQESADWARQSTALRIQQAFLYEDLREIQGHLERGPAAAVLPNVQLLLTDWLKRLDRQEKEERRLRQIALNLEGSCGP